METVNESGAGNDMNTLLYCSHIGETLHCESEESKERAGYGDGAMVVYSTINNPGMSNKQ